jgi:hypothetical protein
MVNFVFHSMTDLTQYSPFYNWDSRRLLIPIPVFANLWTLNGSLGSALEIDQSSTIVRKKFFSLQP